MATGLAVGLGCGPWGHLFFYHFPSCVTELLDLYLRDSKDMKQVQKENTFYI